MEVTAVGPAEVVQAWLAFVEPQRTLKLSYAQGWCGLFQICAKSHTQQGDIDSINCRYLQVDARRLQIWR